MARILDLRHVFVARGDATVLHDLCLTMEACESIALLGPNGCGKSTLIKTITCECYPLVRPESSVRIFGRERWDLTELKKRMGVVLPELPGRPTLKISGRDAVISGFFSSSTLWPNLVVTDAMRARAEQVLEQLDSIGLAEKLVGEMSAGQQRRIMIGRALAGSGGVSGEGKEMLLLDEPSNALDLSAQQEMRAVLRGLAQRGTTILLVTHHISDILPEIGRVVMMKGGRVVADGDKTSLLTAPVLSDLFGTRVSVEERDGFYHAW